MAHQNNANSKSTFNPSSQTPKQTALAERLLKVKSFISITRLALLYEMNESNKPAFFDMSETLEMCEGWIGDCADELTD